MLGQPMQYNQGPMLKPVGLVRPQLGMTLTAPMARNVQDQPAQVGQPGFARMGGFQPIGLRPPTIRPMQDVRTFQNGPQQYRQMQQHDCTREDPQIAKLRELRNSSGLKHIPVASSLLAFRSKKNPELSSDDFLDAYRHLLTSFNVPIPDQDTQNRVFALFDKDSNKVVDMIELVCGISLLCKGDEDDKIEAIFNVFDENGDGFITMDEMFKFLTGVYKVVLSAKVQQTMKQIGVDAESPEDLASVTALECFKTADLNGDGKLSLHEFKHWFYAREKQ